MNNHHVLDVVVALALGVMLGLAVAAAVTAGRAVAEVKE